MKYKAVAIDETKHWVDSISKSAGKIFCVCIYNSEEVTHCCEITPSYYLIPIYSYCENEVSEEIKEEIICNDILEPFYVHCSSIDSMQNVDAGNFETEDEAHEQNRCNVPM